MVNAHLNDLQLDALGEVFNIGVGRAAAGLSMIVNDEVRISAPKVELVAPEDVQKTLLGKEFQNFSTVSQQFSGPFEARAILIFPESNALSIVSHMLGDGIPPDELSEYEQEAMCEVGNIILNACISALADIFDVSIEGGLPEHQFCDSNTIDFRSCYDQEIVLVLQVDMSICQEKIEGHLVFVLSVSSLKSLIVCLDSYLRKQGLIE
jgi:chemotaxis protein CheC